MEDEEMYEGKCYDCEQVKPCLQYVSCCTGTRIEICPECNERQRLEAVRIWREQSCLPDIEGIRSSLEEEVTIDVTPRYDILKEFDFGDADV